MNWPVFFNPGMLGWLALLAIPILIHLLLRTRKFKMRFSTLLFFKKLDEESARRRKVKNWLLLVARVLLLAIIVFAFARPYWPDNATDALKQGRRQLIFVVDRSASLLAEDHEGQRWSRVKRAGQKVLAELKPNDRAALIAGSAQAEILSELAPAAEVQKLLGKLEPNHGAADIGKGLQQAARLLGRSPPADTNFIYVLSDLQRSSCRNIRYYPIPKGVAVKLISAGDLLAPNLAVTDLRLMTGDNRKSHVSLANFSDEEAPPSQLQLIIDGKAAVTFPIALPAAGTTNFELSLPPLPPGWHVGEVRLEIQDALAVDNARYQTFYLPPPLRAIVVETRQAPKLFLEESFFIISALDPAFGLSNNPASPFALEKCAPGELTAKLAAPPGSSPCEVVVLPGLKTIPAGLGAALAAYVQAGGGLVLFLGDGISLNGYQSEFRELLPGRFEKFETAAELDWRLWDYDERSPIFAAFRAANSGNLTLAKFKQRVAVQVKEDNSVLARFQDGTPLIIARTYGQGKVVLVNTTADTAWSDWPQKKTFVPWLHCLMRYLAGRRAEELFNPGPALLAGSGMEIEVPAALKGNSLKIRAPNGFETNATVDAQARLTELDLPFSGVYSLRDPQGTEIHKLAVNVPVAESDLAAMPTSEFEQQIARLEDSPNTFQVGLLGHNSDRRELWHALLFAGLVLLFLETLLGNRTLT